MSSFNYSIFLCDCCEPSKSFRNLYALQQHEKASRPIQDVIVKEVPRNASVQVPVVQTTVMPQIINNNNTQGGVWLMCSCCNPFQLFSNASDLALHINNRMNRSSIIYQAPGNASFTIVLNTNRPMTMQIGNTNIFADATVAVETLTTRRGTMPNALPQSNSGNFLASTILSTSIESLANVATMEIRDAESGPIISQSNSDITFLRPKPFAATPIQSPMIAQNNSGNFLASTILSPSTESLANVATMEILNAESGPIISKSQSENTFLRSQSFAATPIQSPMIAQSNAGNFLASTILSPSTESLTNVATMEKLEAKSGHITSQNDSEITFLRSEPFVATPIESPITDSMPIIGRPKQSENTSLRPEPFAATPIESPITDSMPIIGRPKQSENTSLRPEPFAAAPIESPMTEKTPNTGLLETNDRILKCVYCEFTSKTQFDLHQHIGEHWSGDMGRSCPLCGELYMRIDTLLRHHRECLLKNKSKETDLECLYCEETEKTEPELHRHIVDHWKQDGNKNCPLCEKPFITIAGLLGHHRKIHLREKSLRCLYCEDTIKNERELHKHIGKHWRDGERHGCPLCEKPFPTISDLLRHHRKCLLKNEPRETDLECVYCEETKKTEPELHRHIVDHWKQDENKNCPLCEKPFLTIAGLLGHHRNIHLSEKSLRCLYCEDTTKTERELHEHIEKHWRDGKRHACPLCEKPFPTVSDLLRHHRKVHVRNKPYERKWRCVYCKVTSETQTELHQHIGNHWREDNSQSCPRCDTPFVNIRDLLRHHNRRQCIRVKRTSKWDKRLKCVYCENTSKTRLELRKHIEKHLREDADNRCPFCKKLFTSTYHLIRHHRESHLILCPYCKESTEDEGKMLEHLRCHEDEDSYFCKKCKGAFTSGALLLEHVKSHIRDKYLCDLCERRFREKSELESHITDIHLRLSKYNCAECPKSYFTQVSLNNHIYLHHTDNVPVYNCSECGLQFKQKWLYDDHILRHQGFTPYACDKCDRQFPSSHQLKSHMKCHQKPIKCAYCPKRFKGIFFLHEHERAHVNKPELVQCSFCERTFKHRYYLKRHEKHFHLERKVRPQCSICKKTFSSADYLKKHISAVHEDGGGYSCSLCDKKFVLKRHVELHMALHRPEKPFKCPHCPHACRYQSNLGKHIKIHNKGKKSAKSKK